MNEKKRINALNNGRKYVGKTYIDEEDEELSQRFDVLDSGKYVLRVDFTKQEIESKETFCRGISDFISRMYSHKIPKVLH